MKPQTLSVSENGTSENSLPRELSEVALPPHSADLGTLAPESTSFQVFFSHSLIPLYIFDYETLKFLAVNDAAVTQYGYTSEEFLQLYATELQPNEEVPRFVAFLHEQVPEWLSTGGPHKWYTTGNWKHRRKNGTVLDAYVSIHMIEFHGRSALAASAFDITEMLRVDATLRYSSELVYQLTDNLDAVFWVALPNLSRFLYVSAAYEKVWGRSRAGLYTNPLSFLDSIHPEDRASLVNAVQQRLETLDLEFRIIHTSGEVRWIHGRTFPIRGTGGETIRIAGIAEDITEERQSADKLRCSEEQLRQLTENVTAVFWISTPDGNQTLYISRAYEKIWGRSLASAYESPWSFTDAIHPEDRDRVVKVLMSPWTKDRPPLEHEYRIMRSPSEVVWIHERIYPVKNEAGEVLRVVGISEDISVQKQAQAALENISRQLVAAQEAERRYFASELHDEIGQTLTALKINAETLLKDSPRHLHTHLRDCIHMLNGTIEQVRNLCLDLRPSQLDDLGLVPTLQWYVDRQQQRTGLTIHLSTTVFARQSPMIETTCFRIVQEALTNVVRHAQTREVWIELQPCRGAIELVIYDRGVGFDCQTMRMRALQGRSSGILGMEERVRLAGGTFELLAHPRQGVRIRVMLPRQDVKSSIGALRDIPTPVRPAKTRSGKKVKTATLNQARAPR